MVGYVPPFGMYAYGAMTSADIRSHGPGAAVLFKKDGSPLLVIAPTRDHTGNTVETWLGALHTAVVFGRPYQIFVAFLGLVIAMFSVTGVYFWWKKRAVRKRRKNRPATSTAEAVA